MPRPVRAAQTIQPRRGRFLPAADILAHLVKLRRGDVEAIAPSVLYFDIVFLHAVHGHTLDSRETSDSVPLVHDDVPRRQIRIGLQFLTVGRLFRRFRDFLRRRVKLSFRQNGEFQIGPFAPGGQRAQSDTDFPGRRYRHALERERGENAAFLQEPVQIQGAAVRRAQD